jgi:cytochrome oxidase assembly protein ShyY1
MTMPTRIIPVLSFSAGGLVLVYLGLIVTTVLFATWQTQAASSIRDAQATIGTLDSTDPATLGFVHPSQVEYVAAANLPGNLTFAGR